MLRRDPAMTTVSRNRVKYAVRSPLDNGAMIVPKKCRVRVRKGSDVLERLISKLIEVLAETGKRFEEIHLGPLEDDDFALNRSCPAYVSARPTSSRFRDASGSAQTGHPRGA